MSTGNDAERALRDDGLHEAARDVAEAAKRNMPVGDPAEDPNIAVALRESVNITPDGLGFIISVDTPYAAKQHEDQSLKHPRGGGPKYLERALTELMPTFERTVASKVDARMAKGFASNPRRPHR